MPQPDNSRNLRAMRGIQPCRLNGPQAEDGGCETENC